jgi:DNA-binding GntR family transcriptional regulator
MTNRSRTKRPTLTDIALDQIRESIVSGELAPGTVIRLKDQVEALDMSSVPIREALRYLEQCGLVDRDPHRGVYVAQMSRSDLEETYQLRIELECIAVRKAAARMTADEMGELYKLIETYETSALSDSVASLRDHEKLHSRLYDFAGSKWLSHILPMLWDNSERYRILIAGEHLQSRIDEHRHIVDACADNDPELAESELRSHLEHSLNLLIETIDSTSFDKADSVDQPG